MKQDAKQHRVSPQGIQIMIAGFIQVYEFVIGQSTPSISNMLGELRSHPSNPAMIRNDGYWVHENLQPFGIKGSFGSLTTRFFYEHFS